MSKRTKIIVTILILGAIGAGAFLIWGQSDEPENTNNTQTTQQPVITENTDEPEEITANINYTDNGFEPTSLTISAGDTVEIVNQSQNMLEFSSDDHPTHRIQQELNAATIQPGERTTITITQTGTWGFHNHLNSAHTGTIEVK